MHIFVFWHSCVVVVLDASLEIGERSNGIEFCDILALVFQRADNSIQWINHYPADKMHSNQRMISGAFSE